MDYVVWMGGPLSVMKVLGSGFSSHIGWIVRSVTHRNAVMGAFSASPDEIRLVLARSVVTYRRKSEDNIKYI